MSDSNLPRRSFLKLAGLGVVGIGIGGDGPFGLGPRFVAVKPSRRGFAEANVKLGVASYSLRNFTRAQAIEMTKALGVRYINLKSVHLPYEASASELAAARQEVEAAGLVIVGGGTITFESDTDDGVRKYFDYAKASGMPLIVCTCKPAILARVEKFAKQYDIRVAIHNHGPEDENFPSPYDALRAVKGMDPRMGLCIDLGHTVRTGTDVVRAIADAGPRLLDMHAKDLRDLKVAESQCIVGDGKMPIPEILRQLRKSRYAGYVNLEYEIDADNPLPGMKQSLAYMRGVLAALALERS
ncbi:MAG: sugar phosphate isomerase/epimerase family protein [Gemmatimonadaceae bacterium]